MQALVLLALLFLPPGSRAEEPISRGTAARCSFFPVIGSRSPSSTHLLGTATADSLRAGAGEVRVGREAGRWSRRARANVHGQVVRVQRFGGADSAAVAAAFEASGTREVVLVPWSYDPMCRPLPWGRSARWLPAGEEHAFLVTPRAKEHWVQGRPTFDAFTVLLDAYPSPLARSAPESLTPGEFYELYRALPSREEMETDPAAARAALARWEEQNPQARNRYPANEMLDMAHRALRRARERADSASAP